jgi:imidazolonepropionase-like amidohydrolase
MKKHILALFLLISLLAAYPVFAQTTAIRAGNMIDPASGTIAKNQIILVKDGKIIEVGPKVTIPAGADVIDLSNAWVMPGLMDAHTHMTFDMKSEDIGIEAIYLKESTAMRAFRGLRNAQDVLHAGFTVIRDVGNDANYAAVDLRDAINKGWFTGPTVLTSGKIITPFGGQSKRIPPEQGFFWLYEYIDADNVNEIRKAVRQNIYYGADLIKLVTDNSAFFYSVEEIRAAVEEAHAAGLRVSVHAIGGEAARNVILGGADSIEHGFMLTDELLKLMKDKGTWLVSTDFPEAHIAALDPTGAVFGGPAKDTAAGIIDRLKRAHQIGVKLVFGTDSVADLPGKNRADMMLDYLSSWEAAGIPPADTLRAMTTEAANLLKIEKTRGQIAPGFAADVIATPANPLDKIQSLRQVKFVMKSGKIVRNDKLAPM